MHHIRRAVIAGIVLLSVNSAGGQAPPRQAGSTGQPPLHQVLTGDKPLDDGRLTTPRHLDAPMAFTPAFTSKSDWETRAAALRRQVQVALGLWPMPERGPVTASIHGRIAREGYTIEKVSFASLPGHYVTGNLYRPAAAAGRRPAVLSPHGHWEGGRLLERPDADIEQDLASGGERTKEGARYPLQARLAMLARLGTVVFMYDMVGYADSTALTHRQGFTDAEAELRLQSFMGLQAWNGLRALDFLASLPDVDPARLAITGESGGGTQTFILSALDARPVVTVPAVMVSGSMQGGCICENSSLLRLDTNNIELAALAAPKPLGVIGANDWTKDIETLGYPELQKIYGLYDATPNVLAKHYPFPHNYNQVSREFMYAWFNQHLKLGHTPPIQEQPFVPAKPAELGVYDAAHARPRDEADAATLRRTLTTRSDAQLRALATRPEALRRVIAGALDVMVGDRPAGTFDTVKGSFQSLKGDGFDVHQSVFTRAGNGSRVPAIGLVPTGWDQGAVVIWVQPEGKASAFAADGRTLVPAIRSLIDAKVAVLLPDVFLTGESRGTFPRVKNDETYAGFNDGYNRTVLANRAYDLLTLVAFAKSTGARQVRLVGLGKAGVWALLARAIAGGAIERAAIDLNGFDFDRVSRLDDEMLLPGALKYGGVLGVAAACTEGRTALFNAPARPAAAWVPASGAVTLESGPATAERLARWVSAE